MIELLQRHIIRKATHMVSKSFPLSFSQQAMFLTQKLYPQSSLFNIGGYCLYNGSFDLEKYLLALEVLLNDQPILCSELFEENGITMQKVSKRTEYTVWVCSAYATNEQVLEFCKQKMKEPIDFSEQLFTLYIFPIAPKKNIVFFRMHHIIGDGFSVQVMLNRIQAVYSDTNFDQPICKSGFFEYIDKEISYIESEKFKVDKEFWLSELKHFNGTGIAFESCRKMSPGKENQIARITFEITRSEFNSINNYCKSLSITPYHYFISALYILNRITNNEDFILGLPILNRTPREHDICGPFLSVLPYIFNTSADESFVDIAKAMSPKLMACYRHVRYPTLEIQKNIQASRLIYNILFSYQENRYSQNLIDSLDSDVVFLNQSEQQEDIVVHLLNDECKNKSGVQLLVDYRTAVFDEHVIKELFNRYVNLLSELYAFPDKKVKDYDPCLEIARDKILNSFNDTIKWFPDTHTIGDLLNKASHDFANRPAVTYNGITMSYSELALKTDKIAEFLQSSGVKENTLVGICMERSLEMFMAIIGTYKSGGAYVPIDPEYPIDRVKYMLSDSSPTIILTQHKFSDLLSSVGNVVILDRDWSIVESVAGFYNRSVANSSNWAYMIYTSGSTGRPKGAINTHKALVNRIYWMQNELKLDENDVVLQKTPFSFDVSVWEFVWPLLFGAHVVIALPGGHRDPSYLIETIKNHKVTTLHFVPSMLSVFLDDEKCENCTSIIRTIICSGEELKQEVAQKCLNKLRCKLYNLYGPTEAAIDVSWWKCNRDIQSTVIPIGKPIDNIALYVLNKYGKLLPVGVTGELYIAGVGLAVGYYNKPELTNTRFIANTIQPNYCDRMYKTGDLSKWDTQGNLLYLGRTDFQVKINGLRIELEEIEHQLLKISYIKSAKVVAKEGKHGNKFLVAYVICNNASIFNAEEIKSILKKNLPTYMIPAIYSSLEKFPLLPNGKLNIDALPNIDDLFLKTDIVHASTESEIELLTLFKEVLGINQIGITDDFFEYGGTSLKAIQLVNRYKKINIHDLYENPTVEKVLRHLSNGSSSFAHIVPLREVIDPKAIILCVPYGGGTPITYRGLTEALPHDVSLYSAKLSGHSYSNKDNNLYNVKDMANLIVEEFKKVINAPVVVYGHCVGCAIAFEIANLLKEGRFTVDNVVLAATYPFSPKGIKGIVIKFLRAYYYSSDKRTIKFLELLGHTQILENEILQEILTWFRHDGYEYEKYFSHLELAKLMKLNQATIITGSEDPLTKFAKRDILRWSELFEFVEYYEIPDAKHYFIEDSPELVANIIMEQLGKSALKPSTQTII